jgi:hypothetical protein
MNKVLIALIATVIGLGMAGCVGKGKAPPPPPIITKG